MKSNSMNFCNMSKIFKAKNWVSTMPNFWDFKNNCPLIKSQESNRLVNLLMVWEKPRLSISGIGCSRLLMLDFYRGLSIGGKLKIDFKWTLMKLFIHIFLSCCHLHTFLWMGDFYWWINLSRNCWKNKGFCLGQAL